MTLLVHPAAMNHRSRRARFASYAGLLRADASHPCTPGNLILIRAVSLPHAEDPSTLLLMAAHPTDHERAGHERVGAFCASAGSPLLGREVLVVLDRPTQVLRHHVSGLYEDGLMLMIDFDVGSARSEPPVPLFNATRDE